MSSSRRAGRAAPALLTALALLSGCSDASSPTVRSIAPGSTPTADVLTTTTSIVVTFDSATLTPPHKTVAHASAFNANGTLLSGKVPAWSSGTPQIATVAPSGVVTGVNTGFVAIRATIDGVTSYSTLSVLPRVPTHMVIGTQPGGAVNGQNLTIQPVILFRDAANAVAAVPSSVTASVASGNATLSGTMTMKAVNGIVRFTNLHVTGSGPVTLNFTSDALPTTTSASFTITDPVGGAEGSLAVLTQPGGAITGSVMTTQPVVRILDKTGQLLASSTLAVTAKRTGGNGVLTGTTTVSAVAGVATFTDLRIDGSGNNVLTFSTAVPALSVASAGFIVGVGPPARLVVRTQPGGAKSSAPFVTQPVVEIRDVANQLTAAALPVTATVATGTGVLSGPMTVNAVNGVATFSQLAITGAGNASLTFTTATTPPLAVTSNVFAVAPPILTLSRDGASAAGGAVITITGNGFGAGDIVQFGGISATNVVFVNPTTLKATVPPGPATDPTAPTAVAVSVIHNGVPMTLANAFTFWPAPTTTWVSWGFEDGTIGPFGSGGQGGSVVSTKAHSGTQSARTMASWSSQVTGLNWSKEQSDIVNGPGRWHRFYVLLPAATLAATATSGQIKLFLSRVNTDPKGFVMLGEGAEFNSNNNMFASRIDEQIQHIANGPIITPDVWHEIQVYEYRDANAHLGYARIWFDGKFQGAATDPLLGSDDPTAVRWFEFGVQYNQHAAAYPLEVYIDDVAVANGYLDPPTP